MPLNVTHNGVPVCAMVLANGHYMFTCYVDGLFDSVVTLENNGEVTLVALGSGLPPYKEVYFCGYSVRFAFLKYLDSFKL